MPGVEWDYFLPEVALDVDGCPNPVMINAIQNAAREFLRETELQTADLDPVDLVTGTAIYTLVVPEGFELVSAREVQVNGTDVFPVAPGNLTSTGYIQIVPTRLVLRPTPESDATGGLVVTSSVVPLKTSPLGKVEDWIASKYLEEIAAGAKARLLANSGRPWSNPAAAKDYEDAFLAGIAGGKFDKSAGVGGAPLRTMTYYR